MQCFDGFFCWFFEFLNQLRSQQLQEMFTGLSCLGCPTSQTDLGLFGQVTQKTDKKTSRTVKRNFGQIKLSLIVKVHFSTKILQNLLFFCEYNKDVTQTYQRSIFLVNKFIFGTNVFLVQWI